MRNLFHISLLFVQKYKKILNNGKRLRIILKYAVDLSRL